MKSARPLGVVVLGAAAAVALVGCGGSGGGKAGATSPHPDELIWVRPSPIEGWQGDKCTISSVPVNPVVYDTLLEIRPDGKGVTGGLASSWSYDNSSHVYTFTIRPTAKFDNGKPVTAADVVFSFKQWMKGPISGFFYQDIRSVRAVGTNMVEVTMKKSDTFLPDLLTWCNSTVYPDNFGGESSSTYFQKPISAGPYEVQSTTDSGGASETITLVRNKYYWNHPGSLIQKIVIEAVADPNERALLFRSKKADLVQYVDQPTQEQLPASDIVNTPPEILLSIVLNTKNPSLSDPKVREAISYAVDRSAIAKAVGQGAVSAPGPLPINEPGSALPTTPYSYDLSKAKQLMAESTHPGGVTVNYTYDQSSYTYQLVAQLLQSQLAKIGVRLHLQGVDNATYQTDVFGGKFQTGAGIVGALSPTIFDPASAVVLFFYTAAGMSTKAAQADLNEGTSSSDPAVIKDSVTKLEADLDAQNGWIGIVDTQQPWAAQPWVKGFHPLQYGIFYPTSLSIK